MCSYYVAECWQNISICFTIVISLGRYTLCHCLFIHIFVCCCCCCCCPLNMRKLSYAIIIVFFFFLCFHDKAYQKIITSIPMDTYLIHGLVCNTPCSFGCCCCFLSPPLLLSNSFLQFSGKNIYFFFACWIVCFILMCAYSVRWPPQHHSLMAHTLSVARMSMSK